MTVTDEEVDAFLEHHGVRGMRWGVRRIYNKTALAHPGIKSKKQQEAIIKRAEKSGRTPEQQKAREKKLHTATILGSAALAAGLVVGGLYAKKHFGTSTSAIKDVSSGKKLAESLVHEPSDIIHVSRGKDVGYTALFRGGLKDPIKELENAGAGTQDGPGIFKRYGKNAEKVRATFLDPEGRKDFSGRPIFHDVILPKHLSKDVNSSKDASKVAWPLIKDVYNAHYHKKLH